MKRGAADEAGPHPCRFFGAKAMTGLLFEGRGKGGSIDRSASGLKIAIPCQECENM